MWYEIKKFVKRLFCSHIYKVTDTVPLYDETTLHRELPETRICQVALFMKCIKCGKLKIETEEVKE